MMRNSNTGLITGMIHVITFFYLDTLSAKIFPGRDLRILFIYAERIAFL